MSYRIILILTLALSANAQASTSQNVELRVAQKLAAAYTGNPEENVDGRLGSALATIMGCEVGQYFAKDGFQQAAEFIAQETSQRMGVSIETARATLNLASKKFKANEKLDKAMQDHCDQSQWAEKFNEPGRMDRWFHGAKATDNIAVAQKIFVALKPEIEANKEALLKGELETAMQNLVGEGSKLYSVVKAIGKIDFASAEALQMAELAAKMTRAELKGSISQQRLAYEAACEPNDAYAARKIAKKAANTASNVIEMTMSPVETMIEIIVEKIMQGDSNSMARLMKDENVAITRNDMVAHEHLQHEKQDDACMNVIRDLEITLRYARAQVFNMLNPLTPNDVRKIENFNKRHLYKPEKYL